MLISKVACVLAFGFLLLITFTILVLPSLVDFNSYAKSNNNENTLPLVSSSRSEGKEHKNPRDVIDANRSSSSSSQHSLSPLVPPSNSSNETSNNKPQSGTLVVTKQVSNEGGGTAKPSDFTITVDGNNPTPSSFDGSSSGTTVQLFKGKYKVTESGPTTNYNSTLSKASSGEIKEGETKACTITNTYFVSPPPITTGKIVVTKKVINVGGGDKKPSDFTITVDGNNPTPSSFDGSSSGTTITINKGSYKVTEKEGPDISYDYVPGKYTPSYPGGCA